MGRGHAISRVYYYLWKERGWHLRWSVEGLGRQSLEFDAETRILMEMKIGNPGEKIDKHNFFQ